MTKDLDLTVIYYTANTLRKKFSDNVREQLLIAIGDIPLISVSRKPIEFGTNVCVGGTKPNLINMYKQILIGAKEAKTKYVALAEDDVLYSPSHFRTYLPDEDTFAYNATKWSIYTWHKAPFFSLKGRMTNTTLIAPRQLLIDALEERFAKYPDVSKIPLKWMVEPGRSAEKYLGVTPRKSRFFYSYEAAVVFSHPDALGYKGLGTRKRAGFIRAIEIPYWGRAEDVMKDFYL